MLFRYHTINNYHEVGIGRIGNRDVINVACLWSNNISIFDFIGVNIALSADTPVHIGLTFFKLTIYLQLFGLTGNTHGKLS